MQRACQLKGRPVYFSLGHLLSDFVQEEIKRNVVVSVAVNRDYLDVSNRIFSCDDKYCIYDTGEVEEVKPGPPESVSEEEYRRAANQVRDKRRRESLLHVLRHPWRWCFNPGMWRWLIFRYFYLIGNRAKIKANPNAVYAGPIH
jgi:hypothetical protein